MFHPSGDILFVVGASESCSSALYAVPVTRDPESREVVDLGPVELDNPVFRGEPGVCGLDAGLETGPQGTLFYTYWRANYMGERPGGISGDEARFSMEEAGVPSSVAGLTFSPHVTDPDTGFGMMQVSVWPGGEIYDVPLEPLGNGVFQPEPAGVFVVLPRQGTGAIQYIPSGPFAGSLMYVNWSFGDIWILEIDADTGCPIDDATGLPGCGSVAPRVHLYASGLGTGPWGLEFDPLTNDFFVSTWGGDPPNTIIQIGGFPRPPHFQRGHVNGDAVVDIADARVILGLLFQGGSRPECLDAADANDDGRLNIVDPIKILRHLFRGDGPLPDPFLTCGRDPTPDGLGCKRFEECALPE